VNVSENGGTVKVNDEPVTEFPKEYSFDTETKVKLEAFPNGGYRFTRWSGSAVSENSTIILDVTCDKTMLAVFNIIPPILTIEKNGNGTISPYEGQNYYRAGTVIKLEASPSMGWTFDGWSQNVDDPESLTTSVTLNADMLVTASFSLVWSIWWTTGIAIGGVAVAGGLFWLTYKNRKSLKWLRIVSRSSYTLLVLRILLGGTFLFAGFAKIGNVSALIGEIEKYQILPVVLAQAYGHVLPILEIMVGLLLVLGIKLRISSAIGGLLVLSFTIAKLAAISRGLDIGVCGCLGTAVPLMSTQSLAIDFILLGLSIYIILFGNKSFSIAWPLWSRWHIFPRYVKDHSSRFSSSAYEVKK
jgi:uncharacterized membrane protein YphA (DoxX/SURF4 family)